MANLNGHDRVSRYTNVDEAAFRALVGDDMNGLIESIQTLADRIGSWTTRTMGLQITVILLLLGVIADIVVRAK